MSDWQRILGALRKGQVNSTDFMAPHVLDDGKPIVRTAARIYDLRTKHGCEIAEHRESNGTSTYTLVREGNTAGSGSTAREPGSLASPSDLDSAAPASLEALFSSADPVEELPRPAIFGWDEEAA